jgi:chromosome partitioning protein
MRRIALVNQKGGVGKTTTAVNLGAALARRGQRVLLIDLDPQANLSTHLGLRVEDSALTSYGVLCANTKVADAIVATSTPGLMVLPTNLDLSGAELELANALGREALLRDALEQFEREQSDAPYDFALFDCPPSLGLLSINGLVAAQEVFIAVQTEFFALQGMTKLVEIVQLIQRRMNPKLQITGIVPCLYDSRLRLAREVLAELRRYFPHQAFTRPIQSNVKLAEAPSYGQTIFEYAPESSGARDYAALADEVLAPRGALPPVAAPAASELAARGSAPKTRVPPAANSHTAKGGTSAPAASRLAAQPATHPEPVLRAPRAPSARSLPGPSAAPRNTAAARRPSATRAAPAPEEAELPELPPDSLALEVLD